MDVTIPAMFFERAARAKAAPFFRSKQADGTFADTSFEDAKARVDALAAGFLTRLQLDLGDRVLILANTREEWVLADFSLLSLGVQTVPVYATLLTEEVGYIAQDTGAKFAVVENQEHLEKLRSVAKGFSFFEKDYPPEATHIEHVFVMDTDGIPPADDWSPLANVEAEGSPLVEETSEEREKRLKSMNRSDLATFCYTSGTTGPPKGVFQTHENVLSLLENVEDTGIFEQRARECGTFLFLPLAHSFGRLMEFGAAYYETIIVFSNMSDLVEDLQKTRPGFLPGAPRMFEKIYTRITSNVENAPAYRQSLFNWALDVGKRRIPYWRTGKSLPFFLNLKMKLADKLVWSKIRDKLGMDRMSCMLSGSAPLALEVQEFFAAAGLLILEAYGLTETSPGLTVNRLHDWKQGTVGKAINGVTLELAADGEILAKGPNITSGYLNRPEATSEAFDKDGWFHTGDIGVLDDELFLRITDRKKDLIKTSGGKYIAPQKIEGRLKAKSMVSEAVVIGEARKYCVVLFTLDDDARTLWRERLGATDALDDPQLLQEVQKYVDEVNGGLASFESIKYFRILNDDFSVDNGLLTASFKLKRKVINERFLGEIEEMYQHQKPPSEASVKS
ncbi:MAG: long-chain fatty acid--CoA ligase [Deltaproteobacteria bacterium]|nr:long-chain fatty acid--CoA ligase [Deltaproteobacteria bacterium]